MHPSLFRVWDDDAHLRLGYLDPTRLTLPRHGPVEDQCTGCHKCLGHGHLTAVNFNKQLDRELRDLQIRKQEIENRVHEVATRRRFEQRTLAHNCLHPTVCSKGELEHFRVANNTTAQYLCTFCQKHIPTSDVG